MLVWKMKHLALRQLHFEGFRVPYGFTSTFSSVVCKLMDKGDQLKLSLVAEKRQKKCLALSSFLRKGHNKHWPIRALYSDAIIIVYLEVRLTKKYSFNIQHPPSLSPYEL